MLKGAVVPKYQMSIFDADFTGGDTDREYKPDIVQEIPKKPAAKITDPFGEHIGNARKELWRGRGLRHDDIALMNSMERDKYIKKDNIWKKPDYIDMIKRGRAVEVVYAIKKIRDSIMPRIPYYRSDNTNELRFKRQEAYITFCSEIRDMAMGLTTEEDLYGICRNFLIDGGYAVKKGNSVRPTPKSGVFLTNKLFKSLNITRTTVLRYRCDIKKTGFGTEKDKKCRNTSNRKKAFIPEQLQNIERSGLTDVRNGRDITGKDFIGIFGIRGGEVGNWLTKKDAQTSLNMAYEAFHDFARVLGIQPGQAAFGRRLSIAFGARGHGKAAAHYEPMREVINLTKMNGAGSLGHELFHALDDILGKKLGLGGMMTEYSKKPASMPYSVRKLMKTMFYREERNPGNEETKEVLTDYMNNSMKMDGRYSRESFGYWSSPCEMFARAGACYLNDRLKEYGGRSGYLCGHSESYVFVHSLPDGSKETIKAIPSGTERTAINNAMEDMITDLRERGLFMTDEERAGIVRDTARARLENGCMLEVSCSGSPAISEGCDACMSYRVYDSYGMLTDDGRIDYNSGEFQSSDVAVMIPKAIDFCFNRKDMGYMLLKKEEKRSLFYMVMYGERRYFENTSGLDAETLCNAYMEYSLPFVEMERYGREIGIEEYAVIEQGANLSFSLGLDSDGDEIVIFDGTRCVRRSMADLTGRISCLQNNFLTGRPKS